ncbi:VWA containing CoxE family protein [Leptospira langatensis]|uniref:VWA containing CoxE family protein n=1 Tax=Leptospira langatensis TaxID=2484983 RepID=A0A5F2A023_9LEPT|nr:VWA containing CoxE family protein [Leptospira langatensis]TGK04137.1 VWA containing CoxE family protein [Leptospira langatensis]TGL43617.1 VWA containing CoxE family protein [Leptospira langatensis]
MFFTFFYRLKASGIPLSTVELLDFLKAVDVLSRPKTFLSVNEFYRISRLCLVKDVKYYDAFDLVFTELFGERGILRESLRQELQDWLSQIFENPNKLPPGIIPPEELWKEFLDRLQNQKGEHHGGNKWIGTGGSSPFGHHGENPGGVRIGGEGGGKSAIFQAMERKYKDYRTDEQLDVRQIKIALKKLRNLRKEGIPEFHLPKTVDATCRNAGDPELVFDRTRKNGIKVLLLMDTGGSMTPYAERVSKLFSAAHQMNHFKEFGYYYFHNSIYDSVYPKGDLRRPIPLKNLFKKHKDDTKVIIVGDAYMAPYELLDPAYGFYHSRFRQETRLPEDPESGLDSFKRLKSHFQEAIWMNPEPKRYWDAPTIYELKKVFPMFFLSVDGLEDGIRRLLNK